MNPNLIPTFISGLSGLVSAIMVGIAILVRGRSKDGRELATLREWKRDASEYMYLLEMATDELCRKTGYKIKVKKPEQLKASYLVSKEKEGNDLEDIAKRLLDQKDPEGRN